MRNRLYRWILYILILLFGIAAGICMTRNKEAVEASKKPKEEKHIKFDDTRTIHWGDDFETIAIESSQDDHKQLAYFYKTQSTEQKPLIVSLHTWSGDYTQKDDLAHMCKEKDLNYIHPNFRGPNKTIEACCSELALADIDDAITYAIENANVDRSKIYVIGVSGGGYATLSTFMKSKHNIRKFSAWASITDLVAWYNESEIRKNGYDKDVVACTGSEDELDIESAQQRSPIYWDTPTDKLKDSELYIYAGVYDGIQGSVPITHSINFYNKILTDMKVLDTTKFVSDVEKLELLEKREALGEFGNIDDRKIHLQKKHDNLRLIIFEGNHEMLTEFALDELLEE